MKKLFLFSAIGLSITGLLTYLSYPSQQNEIPVIHWVTDANPVRKEQIKKFHEWQVANGHTSKPGKPKVELKLDTANRDISKMIIQGVSGVGSDIMDLRSGSGVRYFESMGLLKDLSEDAKQHGYGLDRTFKSIGPELGVPNEEGFKQYAYPCNVSTDLFWLNKAVFSKYKIPMPTNSWTWKDYENLGIQLRDASKAAGDPKVYIGARPDLLTLIRNYGMSIFNETGTECRLNDPQYVNILKKIQYWTEDIKIIPNKADMASFDVQSSFGGVKLALFKSGQFATFTIGRWGLIGFRKGAAMDLSVIYPPHEVIKTSTIRTRCAGIYAGSKNPELAQLFLRYLASETYNDTIIDFADALPPNPNFMEKDSYKKPPQFSNEWGCHEVFSNAAKEIAVAPSHSPFVSQEVAMRLINKWQAKYEVGICSAEEAAKQTQIEINNEIQRTLKEIPAFTNLYNTRKQNQESIDQSRQAGKKVSARLVNNPYFLFHGRKTGWIED